MLVGLAKPRPTPQNSDVYAWAWRNRFEYNEHTFILECQVLAQATFNLMKGSSNIDTVNAGQSLENSHAEVGVTMKGPPQAGNPT